MVEAQAGLNAQAYSQTWLTQGSFAETDPRLWDYPLAAAQELSEFLESWGTSWWAVKKWPIESALDASNCLTELVDAWHFILSQALIEDDGDVERSTVALLEGYAHCTNKGVLSGHRQVVITAKKLMSYLLDYAHTSASQRTIYSKFFELLTAAGFSMDHFHARYLAKLQLNIFRQMNGYKDKPRTYVKEWRPGQEDNYFLATWIDALFDSVRDGKETKMPTEAEIMKWIAANYHMHTNKSAVTPSAIEEKDANS